MKIGEKEIGCLFLAPMAGVSDVGFRAVCSELGADATWSEMLSARAMHHNPKKTTLMTQTTQAERIKIGQIFGHEPDIMAEATRNPLLSHYDIIDLNFGCPAPKIIKNGEGSALMKNLPLAYQIISRCVQASSRPISVKFRLGFDKDISLDFARMCEDAGASFITLHARTALQGYSGRADYEAIARVKASVKISVIGNGDVADEDSYKEMRSTGVDGVMIGRGAQGRPWIFSQLKGLPAPQDKFEVIQRHVDILRSFYDEKWLTLYLRKHFLWYTASFKNASELRARIATSQSIDESLKILASLLK